MRAQRRIGAVLAGVASIAAMTAGSSLAASAGAHERPTFTVSVDSIGVWQNPTDTPASPFIDKDGTFYYEQAEANYALTDPRKWTFFSGGTIDDATAAATINSSVNPANPDDRNNDTTWRCNNSPTGLESTYAPAGSRYSQRNYCDLTNMWVDPDTGDWYGLVHNEFTPQPFGDRLHYDAIDYAISKDQGLTWRFESHVVTSPYSTQRGDIQAFPQQTYDYGDGDPRLYADAASGYFYMYYGSRIVDKTGSWKAFYSHVARAPMSAKMAPGSWQKWYDGAWSQPGLGGRESNLVPTDANRRGYTPPSKEYNPNTPGTADEQIAAGRMPATSPLFVMDITYNAYLGLYLGEPQAVDQSGTAPQQFYATDNLATQKWHLIGDTGSYTNASWYRWFLDSANRTSSSIVGKSFRSYCSYGCSNDGDSEFTDIMIESSRPSAPIDPRRTYRIASGHHRVLRQVPGSTRTTSSSSAHAWLSTWKFTPTGDGAYTISNGTTGQVLGVDSASTTGRAWGTDPVVSRPSSTPTVGQQWFVVSETSVNRGHKTGTFKLVNRYSGLVLAMSADHHRRTETTPVRSWNDTSHSRVGGARTTAEQTLTLHPTYWW
ncbi:MAG: RICIN domain-containing protein [Intrasporangium sp.]|uniref:RICIN domain-containing protein n=1 Tax=Intrasporangium sp. TaxID=1925024 RepID=UPI00264A4362|nr:RICIN domain-containing protein [Intrasporangium sp.]MDN5795717.1 RICIN domain-containing protein [Intrasporangium sp.]